MRTATKGPLPYRKSMFHSTADYQAYLYLFYFTIDGEAEYLSWF